MRPVDPRLLRYARATAGHLAVLVVLGAATAGLVIAQAGLLADTIAGVVEHGVGLAALGTPLILLAAVIAGRAVVAWVTEAEGHRAAARVKSTLRRRLLAHVVDLGPAHLTAHRTGRLTTLATTGVDALDGYFAKYLPQLVLAVVVPAAILARVLPADPVAAVTIAVTLPLIPVFMVLIGLATRAATRNRYDALTRLAHHFLDVVAGLPTLKVFGRAAAQADTIRRITDRYRRSTLATLRIAFLSALVLELIATLSVALVAVGIGLRLVDGHLDLRTALLVLILAPEAYLPLRAVGTHYHASADGLAAAEEVLTVLDTPRPEVGRAAPPTEVTDIALDHVTVTHPDRPEPAPDDASLHLTRGEIVALTGPSGAGKSTLLAVLLGFATPERGRVLVNGYDLAGLDPDRWRRHVGWAAQQPYLFTGTVADNVRLGAPTAGDTAVAAAARDACLDVPLDTPVGEHGAGLSAGQRRRVALARAYLRDADVLLLDEPTAGLDPDTEARVLARLRTVAAGRIVLLVSHRPAALAAADTVVDLAPAPRQPALR
ncbi:MAG TPA: thiol reductant ABC exporter subunit CydD [Actinocatenispora sp.]